MSIEHLDELIEKLNGGDLAAAERVFLAYEPYLRMAVRRQLTGPLRSKLDSMDIVQSVWADILGGFRQAGWRFTDRSHLRAFLMKVARNRLIDRHRQHHRALEQERPLDLAAPEDLTQANQPRPSEIAQERELWRRMLEECSPSHREVLILKRQGLPNAEIARRTGMHEGSIRRILYDLARRLAIPARRSSATPASDPEGD
jgi:RNA polymerase sigma-70 factor (ECF subfamily)